MATVSRQRPGRRRTIYSPYVTDGGRRAPGAVWRALLVIVLVLLLVALAAAVAIRWSTLNAAASRDAAAHPAPAVVIPTVASTPTAAAPARRVTPRASRTATP